MPLKNLATVNRYTGPSNIIRINQERMVELEAELGSLDLKTASGMAEEVLEGMHWPDGYRYELGGAAEEQQESFRYLMIAFLMAGILIYMVMASQLDRLVEPFIIVLTIHPALQGLLSELRATSQPGRATAT